jgi:hypothetical protein
VKFEGCKTDGEREMVAVLECLGCALEKAAGDVGLVGDLVKVVRIILPNGGCLGAELLEKGFKEGFCFLSRELVRLT